MSFKGFVLLFFVIEKYDHDTRISENITHFGSKFCFKLFSYIYATQCFFIETCNNNMMTLTCIIFLFRWKCFQHFMIIIATQHDQLSWNANILITFVYICRETIYVNENVKSKMYHRETQLWKYPRKLQYPGVLPYARYHEWVICKSFINDRLCNNLEYTHQHQILT